MSQLNRHSVISSNAPRPSFTFVGVVKGHSIADPRRPTPTTDYLSVEVVSDPFSQAIGTPSVAGQVVSVFIHPKGGHPNDPAVMANSVHGVIHGYEIRPPIVAGQICAFERAVYEPATKTIQSEYVKVGATPDTRMEGRAITYTEQLAAVLPKRVSGTEVRQSVCVLNLQDTVRFSEFGEVEGLIDEVRFANRSPEGMEIGHPAFLLLSRRLPASQDQDTPAFYRDPTTRLASLVIMSPRAETVGDRDSFTPMTTVTAMLRIADQHRQLVVGREDWYHEFIPGLSMPMGKNIKPGANGRSVGFDLHHAYKLVDADPETQEILEAGFGFAKSVVMAQNSSRTGSWIASFAKPVASLPTIVPPHEMITSQTHPGHKKACLEEINRLIEVRRQEIRMRIERRRQAQSYQPSAQNNRELAHRPAANSRSTWEEPPRQERSQPWPDRRLIV